jgi:hypothetical protein
MVETRFYGFPTAFGTIPGYLKAASIRRAITETEDEVFEDTILML